MTERNDLMRIDMREHAQIRAQVNAGFSALRVQARQIWGDKEGSKLALAGVVIRLMVGVGDLARFNRDWSGVERNDKNAEEWDLKYSELKKELGNIIFSTIRWIDDLGLDVLECLDLAIEAQEKFANSGRPR